jgi:hypothetical protein
MDVKDLEIADIKAIAKSRIEKDKRIQFSLKFIIPAAIFLVLIFTGICISFLEVKNVEVQYTDKNGQAVNFMKEGDAYLIDNEVIAIANYEMPVYKSFLLIYIGLCGVILILLFYYIWTKPRLIRRFVQKWKDTGILEQSEELKEKES